MANLKKRKKENIAALRRNSSVTSHYEISAAGGNSVCEYCESMNGKVFEIFKRRCQIKCVNGIAGRYI